KDARETLSKIEFPMPKRRTVFLTTQQVIAIRAKAHEMGYPSIALAQVLMFELMIRQKDAIGEMIPMSEPGLSDTGYGGKKWLMGIHWNEISDTLILTHRLSKSLRGREAIMDPGAGKTEVFDLKVYPMVMEELQHVTHKTGPLVICEHTGRPWDHKYFATIWRKVADAAGIPKHLQSRDSRAGGITEGRKSGATLENLRHHAGHSQVSTTAGYDRSDLETKNNVQQLRVKNRTQTP